MPLYHINKHALASFALICAITCSPQDSIAANATSLISVCVDWGQRYCGLIDQNGSPVTLPIYKALDGQSDVWIGERRDNKTDVLDLQGKPLGQIDSRDSRIYKFREDVLVGAEERLYHYNGTTIPIENKKIHYVTAVSEGLIRASEEDVNQNIKSGYVDLNLQWVIPPTYDYAGDFHHGFAEIYIGTLGDHKIALIDKTGKMSTPLVPGDRLYWLFENKWLRLSHAEGKGKYDTPESNIIDTDGQILISNISTVTDQKGARIVPYSQKKKKKECGLLDLATLQKIPVASESCQTPYGFSDGVIWFSGKNDIEFTPRTWQLVNQRGKTLFEIDYDYPSPFDHGFSIVKNHSRDYGVIDKNNRVVFPFEYKKIEAPWPTWVKTPNVGGIWWFTKKDAPQTQVLMNSSGKPLITVQHRVVQKKGEPCSDYTNGIDIVTNAKGERLWEKERLEACRR